MRRRIIIDFDNTLINTAKGVINCCREDNPDREIPEYGAKEVTWNFENYNLPNDFGKYFQDKRTYKKEYIMDNCLEVLEELSKDYDLHVCTRCSYGMDMKKEFIEENFPMIKSVIFICSDDFREKVMISNNWGDYMIDDKPECFHGSNRFNILFGDYEWNKDKNGSRINVTCTDWLKVKEVIDKRKFMLEE